MKFVLMYAYDPAQAGPSTKEVSRWLAFEQEVKTQAPTCTRRDSSRPAKLAR